MEICRRNKGYGAILVSLCSTCKCNGRNENRILVVVLVVSGCPALEFHFIFILGIEHIVDRNPELPVTGFCLLALVGNTLHDFTCSFVGHFILQHTDLVVHACGHVKVAISNQFSYRNATHEVNGYRTVG